MNDKGGGSENRQSTRDRTPKPKDRAQRFGNQVRDSIRAAANFFKRMVGRK